MRAFYDSKSNSIDDRGIKDLLSENEKYQTWLLFEASLAEAQAEAGFIPKNAAIDIKNAAKIENIDLEKVTELKAEIGHGFMPFVKVFSSIVPRDSGRYVHFGITTQNIQQSSQLYIAKKIHRIFMDFLADILENLSMLSIEYNDAVMAGRTHGRHATPITYGYKVSVWISEFIEAAERMAEVEKRTFKIMMGGAVGTFSAMPEIGPTVQKRVAELVDMGYMEVPSRNISTHKIEYIMNLSLLANSCHKIAEEVYSTTLEEIAEVSEGFSEGTVGSSTMPHKINPKLAKGIIANSQKLYSLPSVASYSSVRPFEGDSSSYMLFDGILEEALQLMTEILMRTAELTETICPHRERLLENVQNNKGLDNSEYIMMKLGEKLGKVLAHETLYKIAIKTAHEGQDFKSNLLSDPLISSEFSKKEILEMINPENYIGLAKEIAFEQGKKARLIASKLKHDYAIE